MKKENMPATSYKNKCVAVTSLVFLGWLLALSQFPSFYKEKSEALKGTQTSIPQIKTETPKEIKTSVVKDASIQDTQDHTILFESRDKEKEKQSDGWLKSRDGEKEEIRDEEWRRVGGTSWLPFLPPPLPGQLWLNVLQNSLTKERKTSQAFPRWR